eukprot:TRINITY_DN11080_c0_g1_i1.p1 TRINITY_DN11080_c0_g1~~TRINITY_DN11080_c0_g1_i1.p1  ORF type:complete len:69 (-),score=6.24 TRINITY_DN11080_c0_g1_i1:128-334(-)
MCGKKRWFLGEWVSFFCVWCAYACGVLSKPQNEFSRLPVPIFNSNCCHSEIQRKLGNKQGADGLLSVV